MDIVKYSIEHLYHFQCQKGCGAWWTVGDFQEISHKLNVVFCPHCGKKYKTVNDEISQCHESDKLEKN